MRLHRDDLIDALMDLKHDLGKYILLPVSMLPADVDQEELRAALASALRNTRVGPESVSNARDIWQAFLTEAEQAATEYKKFVNLRDAVEAALALETQLAADTFLDRSSITKILQNVSERIWMLVEEVNQK